MLVAAGVEFEQLRLQVARRRFLAFGRSAVRLTCEADQLELGLEGSEAAASLAPTAARHCQAVAPAAARTPATRGLIAWSYWRRARQAAARRAHLEVRMQL